MVLNSLISLLNIRRLSQIELFKNDPIQVQKSCLFDLLQTAAMTEWGEKYDFKSIKSRHEFAQRVPIQTYESLQPFIERTLKGEKNILWSEETKWFAKSSGTTSAKSKFIPVSKSSLEDCHFRGGKDIIAIYNNLYPDNSMFKGKSLALGGSHEVSQYNSQSFYGDLSAIIIENLPFWADFARTPDSSIMLMSEWEEKLIKITESTVNENVTSLAGVPSWFLTLIRTLLHKTGKNDLHEIWPNLELFVHGGVSFVPYKEQYQQLCPKKGMHYMETYNASEGFFAIQDDPEDDSMLLMLDYGIYYEFMPMTELDREYPRTLLLDEVEIGKSYAMIISTNGGLWRYMIGDTVTFTSLSPMKIKITGRTKLFINAFGEEIIMDNATAAINKACECTGAEVREYTAAPIFIRNDTKGAHEWLIEFAKQPSSLDLFTETLDKELQNVNSDYEAKRYKNITLEILKLRVAREGVFYEWMKNKGKLGGQNKVPRLWNNREHIDELLVLNVK
jgi:hypothetical protein